MKAIIRPYGIEPSKQGTPKRIEVHLEDDDYWNLDYTLSFIIYESLTKFKKNTPVCFTDSMQPDLDKAIKAFYIYTRGSNEDGIWGSGFSKKEQDIEIQEGLEAFARIYRALWT